MEPPPTAAPAIDLDPPATAAPGRSRPRWAWAVLAVVLAYHAVQTARLFPSLAAFLDPEAPVVMVDHAIHLYHGSLGAGFLRDHGTTWGMDPSFLAGYPETPVWDSSSNPSIAFQWLAGGGYRPRAYKVGLLLFGLMIPVLVAGGAWALGLGLGEVAIAAGLATVYFWGAFPSWLWRSGLFAFITAAAGVPLLIGLAVRFGRIPTRRGWAGMLACGAGLFAIHVTTPVMAAAGLAAFYLGTLRTHPRRWHAAVWLAVALTVGVNLVWLASLWRFRGLRIGSGFFMTTDSPLYLLELYLAPMPDNRLNLFLLVPGLAGLVVWRRRGSRAAALAWGVAILFLLALIALGSEWEPTKLLEPLRFRIPLQFLLAVPAGSALVAGTARLARRAGTAGAVAAWLVALGAWAGVDRTMARAIATALVHGRPLVVGISPEARKLVAWVRANTDASARILLEDQLRLIEATDPESVHWTPLLPVLLGPDARMFLGGLYQTAFIRHHRMASFGDFQLGDRPIDRWTPQAFDGYCRQYNVGWVMAWSPLSRFWFDRCPGVKRVATLPRLATPGRPASPIEDEWKAIARRAGGAVANRYFLEGEGHYTVYEVDRPRSFFLRGKGRVVGFGPNRIELADVEPEGGSALLSLHWQDGWRADPPVAIGPEPVPGDEVPFIKITTDRPIPRLVIENRY